MRGVLPGALLMTVLAAPAPALAQLPAPRLPPSEPTAGVTVRWPTADGRLEFAGGRSVSVRVRSTRRRSTVSLVRVSTKGRVMRTIARRTVRSGTFTATVPPVLGATYALRLAIGRQRYWSWIVTTSIDPCPDSWFEAKAQADPQVVAAGATFTLSVTSEKGSCVSGGAGYVLERQLADGTWERLPNPGPVNANGYGGPLLPGKPITRLVSIPPGAAPGTYRVIPDLTYTTADGAWHPLVAYVSVTA